jgi:hypothetical protein
MLSLLYKAYDVFTGEYLDDDLIYKVNFKDNTNRLDVGLLGGVGFHLDAAHGMNLGVRYYQGLRNVEKNKSTLSNINSNLMVFASIPIGAGEKAKAKQAAAKEKRENKKAEKEKKKAAKQTEKEEKK